jgi:hypothetical protein
MPRKNRLPAHRRPQHARGKARPQGLHKKSRSPNVIEGIQWLDQARRIEGEAA